MKCKWTFMMLFVVVAALAQQKKTAAQCQESFKAFEAKAAEGNYDEAATLYAPLQKDCPKVDEKLYQTAETIYLHKAEVAPKGEKQRTELDKLLLVYTQYAKNFPASAVKADIRRAMLQKRYKLAADDEVFKTLDAAFSKTPVAFTDHDALETYFLLYLKRFEENKGITQDQLIAKYAEVSGQVATAKTTVIQERDALTAKETNGTISSTEKAQIAALNERIDSFTAVEENADILARRHFNCDKLEAFYAAGFEANKSSAQWLQNAVNTLYKSRCNNSATLQKTAAAWHAMSPTAKSAMYMGLLAQRKNDITGAVTYFDEAAKLETTAEKKAEMYYTAATLLRQNNKKQAKDYALKAAQLNTKSGRPYILLAEMYTSAGKECEMTDFERKALVWLAAETLKKAEQAEPKYKATADAMMISLNKKAPVKADLKQAGKKAGQKITYGCWINETITIPNF
ncbi:MAG: tetratricopeptide repeat protein [Flavobacterium sp.]